MSQDIVGESAQSFGDPMALILTMFDRFVDTDRGFVKAPPAALLQTFGTAERHRAFFGIRQHRRNAD
jgi:hypothetical protein